MASQGAPALGIAQVVGVGRGISWGVGVVQGRGRPRVSPKVSPGVSREVSQVVRTGRRWPSCSISYPRPFSLVYWSINEFKSQV